MFYYLYHYPQPLEYLKKDDSKQRESKKDVESTRGRQLSHVLYDKIVQIINTGELADELFHKQVFIMSVCSSFLIIYNILRHCIMSE